MRTIAAALGLVLVGCSGPAPKADPPANVPQTNPAAVLARQGVVLIEGALGSVADAREAALAEQAKAKGERRQALDEAVALIDSAGASLADYSEAPAESDPAALGRWRKQAAEAAGDALIDLGEARGIVESLGDSATLAAIVQVAEDDVREAVEGLGGKAEEAPG